MNYTEFAQKIKAKYPGSYDDMDDKTLAQKMVAKFPQYSDVTFDGPQTPESPKKPGMLKQSWDTLGIPAKMSREGLDQLAGFVPGKEPSGNMVTDLALNAPKVAAESIAEVAPTFIDQAAILTAGLGAGVKAATRNPLVKKVGSVVGSKLAEGVEKTIGIDAQAVETAFKKPLELFMAPTKKGVAKAYSNSELKQAYKTIEDVVADGTASDASLVKRAGRLIIKGSKINPTEQAEQIVAGRKALDAQIAGIESKITTAKTGRSALQNKMQSKLALREQFNKALDVLAPKHRLGDAAAARNFSVEPFRRIALPGKINFTSPEGIARAIPGLPGVVGTGISAAGGAAKLAGKALDAAPKASYTAAIAGLAAARQRKRKAK